MTPMTPRTLLILLFAAILASMLAVTSWASLVQPIWEWQGLVARPDHAWTTATLFDAYFGFLTFYAWVHHKERGAGARGLWFASIMLFGNIAMSIYVLRELLRLRPGEPVATLLTRRPA